MANCEHIQSKLNALIDGELPISKRLAVRLHVIKCSECRARLEQYRRLSDVAAKVRIFDVVPKRTNMPVRFAFSGAAFVMLAVIAFQFWPKPKTPPQALVFDVSALSGKAMPVSAIYSENNRFVVRDSQNGNVLASAPGTSRTDAFNAISMANHALPSNPKQFEIVLDTNATDTPIGSGELLILKGDGLPETNGEPVMIFFSGDITELKGIKLPKEGPVFLVKVLDPKFIDDTGGWQRTTPTLPPNKTPL